MGFADELRRSKPTREELKAEKERETRIRKEGEEKYFQSIVDFYVESIKSSCRSENNRGKRHYSGRNILRGAERVYAKRMRSVVSARLKEEGFTAIVTLGKDNMGDLCLKYRVFW